MPIRVEIDPILRLRIISFEGAVSDDDLLAFFPRYWKSPDYDPLLDEFYDDSGVSEVTISGSGVRKLAEINLEMHLEAPGVKVAVYAPSDVAFGLNRMYQALVEPTASEMQVFRDRDEALDWLRPERR